MKTVVYLDILLLVNFLIGFLMVGTVGILTGRPPAFGRQVLGGAVAAGLSLSILLPPWPWGVQLLWQLAGCCGVVWAAFGRTGPRGFVLRTLLLAAGNLLVAGLVIVSCVKLGLPGVHTNNLQVYLYISPQVLFWASVGVYLAGWLFWRLWGKNLPRPQYGLTLELQGRTLQVEALLDTGFSLEDPWSGRPVILLSLADLAPALDPDLAKAMGDWAGKDACRLGGLRLIPCATVGGKGLLPALPARLRWKKGAWIQVLAVFSGEKIRAGEGVSALVGQDLARLLEII